MSKRMRWTVLASLAIVLVVWYGVSHTTVTLVSGDTSKSVPLTDAFSAIRGPIPDAALPDTASGAQPPAEVRLKSSGAIVRTFAPESGWKRVWMTGSDSSSDTWVEPRQLVISGDMVVVLDDGTREVRGLDRQTGSPRLVMLPRGQGPGEFKRPSLLSNTPTGFAILDQANGRLTAYNSAGKLEWDAVFTDAVMIRGLCIGAGPRILAYYNRRDSTIVEYDSTGRHAAVRTVPWTATDTTKEGFAYTAFISDGAANGACVLAPLFGARWGVVPSTGPVRMYGLKEPGEPAITKTTTRVIDKSDGVITLVQPETSQSAQSSRGALIRGDTAIVYAAHTKQYPRRILDYYLLSSGQYLYSRLLPLTFNALTIDGDGTFYGTAISDKVQVVVALRPVKLPNPQPR